MKEKLITFETAKLAKEKGFVNMAIPQIYIAEDTLWNYDIHGSCSKYNYVEAPTQSLLQKWLREEHNIHVEVNVESDYSTKEVWQGSYIGNVLTDGKFTQDIYEKSYEQCLELVLQEAIELI